MPLFVLLVLLVTGAPIKTASPGNAEQIDRNREEMRELKKKHGDDADKRFRESMRVL